MLEREQRSTHMRNKLSLEDAAHMRSAGDNSFFFSYVLEFSNGSVYIGSACGTYRLRLYLSISKGRNKLDTNPLLITALKTYECVVSIQTHGSLSVAREHEKILYNKYALQKFNLLNCREFGHAGKWIKQDSSTYEKRIGAIRKNGASLAFLKEKLPDGRSRSAIKGVISRLLSRNHNLGKLADIDETLLNELLEEIRSAKKAT